MELKNIVIVGGGFGGVGVAKHLAQKLPRGYRIVLINTSHHHIFHPDLYELVTSPVPEIFGPISADYVRLLDSARVSFFDIFLNDLSVSILEDAAVGIDEIKHEVRTALGKRIPYEYVVLAMGSEPNFFGIAGIEERAYTFTTPADAVNIRNAVDEVFARSAKNKEINIVVVGGGFTGCELSASLVRLVDRLSLLHGHPRHGASIKLVEAGGELLGGASLWARRKTANRLVRLGVHIILESPVQSVSDHELVTPAERIVFDVLVWTVGAVAHSLPGSLRQAKTQPDGRMLADEYLRITPYKNIFGIGDILFVTGRDKEKPLPMAASVAVQEVPHVAKNILRAVQEKKLKKHKLSHLGFVIPLGQKYAVVDLGFIKFSSVAGAWLRELIALRYYIGILGLRRAFKKWKSRFSVFV